MIAVSIYHTTERLYRTVCRSETLHWS